MPAEVPARATGRATIAQGTLSGPDDWSTYWGPVPDAAHWIRSRLVAAELVWMQHPRDNGSQNDRAMAFRFACVMVAVTGWLCEWGTREWNWNCARLAADDNAPQYFTAPNDTAAPDERERYVSYSGPVAGINALVQVLGPLLSDEECDAVYAGTSNGVLYAGGSLEPPVSVGIMSPSIARSALSRVYAAIPADVMQRYGMPAAPGAASGASHSNSHNGGNTNPGGDGGDASTPDTNPPAQSSGGGGAMVALLLAGLLWASTRRRTR